MWALLICSSDFGLDCGLHIRLALAILSLFPLLLSTQAPPLRLAGTAGRGHQIARGSAAPRSRAPGTGCRARQPTHGQRRPDTPSNRRTPATESRTQDGGYFLFGISLKSLSRENTTFEGLPAPVRDCQIVKRESMGEGDHMGEIRMRVTRVKHKAASTTCLKNTNTK